MQVLASQTWRLQQAFTPEVCEALAAHRCATLALELGFLKAILEGDSQRLMSALHHGKEVLSPDGLLVDDIHLCSRFFIELRYSHARRESNKVAHSLVRYASHILDFIVWMKDVPSQIFLFYQPDLADF